jgi:hypothetical protein
MTKKKRSTKVVPAPVPVATSWFSDLWHGRSTFSGWDSLPPWRKLTCHISPAIFAVLVGFGILFLVGDRYEPRTILSARAQPESVVPGQIISVVYTVRDQKECDGVVHRWIIDSKGSLYALSDTTVFHNYDVGSYGKAFSFNREIMVPYNIALGPATYHAVTERYCNALQHFVWSIHSSDQAKFNVVASGSEGTRVIAPLGGSPTEATAKPQPPSGIQ